MERKVFLFIVLAFGLFVGKAQTVSKERLIEIADSVYNLPRFADYQIKNGEPVVIEKKNQEIESITIICPTPIFIVRGIT